MFSTVPLNRKKADLLLVNVDFAKSLLGAESEPANHLGLWRLGSYLEAKEIPVAILNTTDYRGKDGVKDLVEWLRENQAKFQSLGFHLLSWNVSLVTEILEELIRRRHGAVSPSADILNKPIFFGGPLATAAPREVLEHFGKLGFEKLGLVAGYGECVLERALRDLQHFERVPGIWARVTKRKTLLDLTRELIPGLGSVIKPKTPLSYLTAPFTARTSQPEIIAGNVQRLTSAELDALPLLNPKLNSFYQNCYAPVLDAGKLGKFSQAEIFSAQGLDVNQGCAFACSYCSSPAYGQSVATYSPKRVVNEIQTLAEKTGFFIFTFTNSNVLFYTREWLREFCEEILQRGMENYLNWNGYHHPNTLDLLNVEDFKLMKKAGCEHIVVGVQTIEPEIARLFHRPLDTREKIASINRKVKAADQSLVLDYITDVPGEDWQAIKKFFAWCEQEKIECREFTLKLYPGTPLIEKFSNKPQISNSKNKTPTDFELVPILGNLAPALDSYAVIAKKPNPVAGEISTRLRNSNAAILKTRPLRVGKYFITSPEQTRELIEKEIPHNTAIPEKVKRAMTILFIDILEGTEKKPDQNFAEQALRNLILTPDDAPPIQVKMRERLKVELGPEKFEALKKKYLGH